MSGSPRGAVSQICEVGIERLDGGARRADRDRVKMVMFCAPILLSLSAPSSLAIELAERFNVALVGFVRGPRANVYAHGWRIH